MATALQHRFVTFYLEDVGGHQTLAVDGSLQVKNHLGGTVGTFPLEPGESYSWYLCGCAPDPFAWRARVPTELRCRVCKQQPRKLFVCSCGVVSPSGTQGVCFWCGLATAAPAHVCRVAGDGIEVLHAAVACPLCGSTPGRVEPPPPKAAASRPSVAAPLPLPRPLPAPVSAKSAVASHPVSVAAAAPTAPPAPFAPAAADRSAPPPAVSAPAETPKSARRSPVLALALAAAVCLGVVLALAVLIHEQTPYARANAAIGRGDLLSPQGSCAVDLYDTLARDEPGSDRVRELGAKIAARLRPEADAAIQRFYAESPDDIDWPRWARAYAFLARIAPGDRQVLGRERYCTAQVALAQSRYQDALDAYRAALALQPDWPLALNGLGKVYVRADASIRNYARARESYLAANRADPRFVFPLLNLAQLALIDNQPEQAASYLRQALAIDPRHANAHRDLARILRKQRRFREAIAEYVECLRYETNPEARTKIQQAIAELSARR